jgi:methylenetetrahydrofolate dehydrogenase (NADP+) / methenyltetrahydrofolate cyclohydrolase
VSARLLDGPTVAAAIRESVLPDVRAFTASAGRPPGLGIVLVGENPSSEIYVRNKVKAGAESGLRVDLERLPATAHLDDLLDLVARLNASGAHDGILVQSPLPDAMGKGAAQRVFDAIDPAKDVDGFHPRPTSAGWCRGARISCRARRRASS